MDLKNLDWLHLALKSTQPLTEMSTRNLHGDKGLPARKANMLSSVSRLTTSCGNLDVSLPCRPPRPVTGIALLYLLSSDSFHNRREVFREGGRLLSPHHAVGNSVKAI
jgi:hypothetical protein